MSNSLKRFSLEGRSVLLTGATGYLGQAMAYALAEAGAYVFVNSRSIGRAKALADTLLAEGLLAEPLVFDVSDNEQIAKAFSRIADRPIHVLINNAYAGDSGTIQSAVADQYRQSFDVTLVAAHSLLRAALPALRLGLELSGDVSVINIASMYGLVSPDLRVYDDAADANPPFYGAAKAALIQWTRYAACELGPHGIRVNSISPGPFPMKKVVEAAPEFVGRLARRVPLGRVGDAAEIQGPVLFLASAASSFVNGTNLVVDGGWTAW